jgi:protein phosphatase
MDGDYFFLCTDGVLENITPEILCEVLAKKISDDEKIKKLFDLCDNKTRDNFTAVLVHVKDGYLPPLPLP